MAHAAVIDRKHTATHFGAGARLGYGRRMDDADYELLMLDKNYSSWSMRPWVVLAHLGVPFRETVILGHKQDAPTRLRAVSPTGRLPVLRHDGLVVWESIAILEYLAEQHPDAGLWPRDRRLRAEARALAAEMHAGFVDLRTNCTMNVVLRTKRTLDAATARDVARLDTIFRERHGKHGPFLLGEFGIVDAMFAPVATRFRTYGIEVSPEARAYVDALLAHPAVARFCEEAAREAEHAPAFVTPGRVHGDGSHDHQPPAPCYAVVFANQLGADAADYGALAAQILERAKTMPGYVDYISTRSAEGYGITVSFWSSLEAIAGWRAEVEHAAAQRLGRTRFYDAYRLEVAKVIRSARFTRRGAP